MATNRVTVKVSDNPNCQARAEHSKEEPAQGYHLKGGLVIDAGGHSIPPVYACSLECIPEAIEAEILGERGTWR